MKVGDTRFLDCPGKGDRTGQNVAQTGSQAQAKALTDRRPEEIAVYHDYRCPALKGAAQGNVQHDCCRAATCLKRGQQDGARLLGRQLGSNRLYEAAVLPADWVFRVVESYQVFVQSLGKWGRRGC